MANSARLIGFAPATDLDRAAKFYAGLLGLELVETSPFACVFRSGTTMLRVTQVEELTPQPFTVLGWEVEDIAGSIDELLVRGVSFTTYEGMGQDDRGIWTTPGGDKVAWFTDPDGNTLSLTEFS
ncbi:MAG: glyoxalase/bleomycin resistance protein/dioxygenase [Amycolatopsis sp.]|jgi:catechol 2,3-dioxygenase-like lactoylglutathione lyase family enzyme|uniref:VOC family protein n=1 Tax=Amycolatopsis sp. TaxID=37632 RepID=UPI002639E628|nr:VOC family protein [Amycolatopsis sp.]MCU1687379.1 glyoxalase/bleomycin resistance protein/dioxygenase [Amycolatopsis sp.]